MIKVLNQDSDYKWFCDNITKLFADYGYSFLAIKNKKVLGSYTSIVDGINDMKSKKNKLGTFIIQRCAPSNNENMLNIASMNFM